MSTDQSFDFSLEPRSFGPFKIGPQAYLIREATEAAHIAYRNATAAGMRMTEDAKGGKSIAVQGGSEADSVLVSRCLFKITPNAVAGQPDNEIQAGEVFVRNLPRRVFAPILAKIKELSEIDAEQETEKVLSDRIASDTAKLEALRKKGVTPGDGPNSSPTTSSP